MTLKLACALFVAFAVCDGLNYDYAPGGPSQFGRFSPYRHSYQFRPYFYHINHPATSEEPTTTARTFIGKEYEGKSAKKSATRYVMGDREVSWLEASLNCKSQGMILASPHTPEEKNDLLEFIMENNLTPKDQYSGYWIGGQRSNDHYEWSSDKQIIDNGWIPGEPNNYLGEDCVELKKGFTLGWNNNYCYLEHKFICERIISSELTKNINKGVKTQESGKENPNSDVPMNSWPSKEEDLVQLFPLTYVEKSADPLESSSPIESKDYPYMYTQQEVQGNPINLDDFNKDLSKALPLPLTLPSVSPYLEPAVYTQTVSEDKREPDLYGQQGLYGNPINSDDLNKDLSKALPLPLTLPTIPPYLEPTETKDYPDFYRQQELYDNPINSEDLNKDPSKALPLPLTLPTIPPYLEPTETKDYPDFYRQQELYDNPISSDDLNEDLPKALPVENPPYFEPTAYIQTVPVDNLEPSTSLPIEDSFISESPIWSRSVVEPVDQEFNPYEQMEQLDETVDEFNPNGPGEIDGYDYYPSDYGLNY
ncbi:uncharacterized protein LOC126746776 isoform X2 [Anthonomus grandis grandis]|uniref:uncharacterized protein LOC126746776 isoform X2 n=1 Tax=Anthonomus grandis grandis TaxID=2921223 RepID=UPI0021659009|nr:uncharacterized protein LOC126746776 isoform X2 [Anthonomus grandis grandis]